MERLDLREAVADASNGDQYLVTDISGPRFHMNDSGLVPVYLRTTGDSERLRPLIELQIICTSRVDVRPVNLTGGELQGTAYAYGSGRVAGLDALLVFTEDDDSEQFIVRLADGAGTVIDFTADRERQELLPHRPDAD
ncbi:hypothetical protein [Nonomuraea sediminis]|uniref:hypothetical protein n=1 Tax=Nonomuraea sediminis TaxID=2835864 RepID=UPI001BDD92AF|nr:hypothetical protein [Nonomuraea sediminis]